MKKLSFPLFVRMSFKVIFVFLLFAGLNFGSQPDGEFYGKEVALEHAIAGSGGVQCYSTYDSCWFWNCTQIYRCAPGGSCYSVSADVWGGSGSC
jgi:hypothetical protein